MSAPALKTAFLGAICLPLLIAGCKSEADQVLSSVTTESDDQAPSAQASATDTASSTRTFKSVTRRFRDWTAVCDNINTCTAYGPADENSGFVMVKLEAGPGATPRVHAGSWSLPSDASRILLDIDGRNYAGKMEALDEADPVLTIRSASAQLISAIANGRGMTLSAGGETTGVSLSGAAAALLWIDERQGRLGTTTALIRKGERPASAVPAAPSAPLITAGAPVAQSNLPKSLARQVAALAPVRQCADDNQGGPAINEEWGVSRLGSDTLLWSVPCGAGAYNFSQLYVTSANDGSGARAVLFPTSGEAQDVLVNSNFDPSTNSLSAFGKGRGLGDCGQMATWAWTGREFALVEEDHMGDCLGVHWEFWPSTWRARN